MRKAGDGEGEAEQREQGTWRPRAADRKQREWLTRPEWVEGVMGWKGPRVGSRGVEKLEAGDYSCPHGFSRRSKRHSPGTEDSNGV